MALNLSRGKPLKYATSNRIASYVGNGILTFINNKIKFQELFNENEIVFYKNENDLIDKIYDLKDDIKKINKISENGKKKYFKLFENKIVSDYLISKILKLRQNLSMAGNKISICIAGKNQCAIDALKYLILNYKKNYNILALPNKMTKEMIHGKSLLKNLLFQKH